MNWSTESDPFSSRVDGAHDPLLVVVAGALKALRERVETLERGQEMKDLAGAMVVQDEEDRKVHLLHGGQVVGTLEPGAACRLAQLLDEAGRSLRARQVEEDLLAVQGRLGELALPELADVPEGVSASVMASVEENP